MRPFNRVLLLILSATLLWAPAVCAEEADGSSVFAQEQREEKRLLFSQYVEEETARREREKYKAPRPEQKKEKVWVAKFSSLYGYDSNVHLNSSRRGGGFFQETISGSFRAVRPDLPGIPWSGRLGFTGYVDSYDYENFETLSYQTTVLGIFSEEMVAEKHQLKIAYDLTILRYPRSDQLTYYGHKIKPSWTFFTSKTSSINFFASYERKDYRDRKALDASNLPAGDGRVDGYSELGINPKFYPNDKTYISATLAAKHNDSNDVYLTYNDYSGWKANALLYQKLGGPLSMALIAGYDFKQYDGLTFSTRETGPSETQADDLYYGGAYLYYDINTSWQLMGSYLYKQNESNNPLLDWTGWTTSVGANLNF